MRGVDPGVDVIRRPVGGDDRREVQRGNEPDYRQSVQSTRSALSRQRGGELRGFLYRYQRLQPLAVGGDQAVAVGVFREQVNELLGSRRDERHITGQHDDVVTRV